MNQGQEPAGAAGRVDLDLLADFAGGALAGTPRADAVQRLVAGDPAWARAYAELLAATAAVHADLGALGMLDEPMPADVTARIDTALAAVRDALGEQGESSTTGRRAGVALASWRGWLRWARPVAVAAGVLACVAIGVTVLQQPPDNDTATSGSASRAQGDRGEAASGSQFSAQRDAPGNPLSSLGSGSLRAMLATGTHYRRDTVAGLATAASAAVPGPGPARQAGELRGLAGDPAVPVELRRLTGAAAFRACLDAIATTRGPLTTSFSVVDFARFEGAPALIVALADQSGTGQVWVVSADCGLSGPGTRFVTPAE